MKETFEIYVPIKAVSINSAYSTARTGRRFLVQAGKDYKEELGWCARGLGRLVNDTNAFYADVQFGFGDRRRRDGDDYLKLLFDAFTGIIYKDDSQISEFHVKRIRGDKYFVRVVFTKLDDLI